MTDHLTIDSASPGQSVSEQFGGSAAPTRPRAILVLLIPLMLVLFIATLDQTIVATAIPTIGQDLHDVSGASWIATVYLLSSAVSTLIFGKLGDMYGRKGIFTASVAIFLVGSLLSGLAPSMGALIAFRALQGIGGGGLSSLVQAIIGDLAPPRQRAKYQAYLGTVAMLAIIAGPLLGGAFATAISWRWIFFINLPIGVVALVMIVRGLHLPVRRSDRRVDFLGGILATAVTSAILLVTVWGGQRFAWTSITIVALVALAVVGLFAYLVVEHRAAEPITPLGLFRVPAFSISSALFFLATLVLFAVMLYVPAFMQEVRHYSPFDAGLFLIPLLVGLIGATGISGSAITRTGRYKIFPVVGAVLSGAGMFAVSMVTAGTPVWLVAALLAIVGAGLGFFVQVAILAGQNAVAPKFLGVATGALNFFKTLGGAFGAAVFGAVLTGALGSGHSYLEAFQTVFFWCVPVMGLALILALLLPEKPLSEEMVAVAEGLVDVPEY